ncbi:hypothetical protein LWI29_032179 [Acer saccharum]|uniref:Uncharacterized protein n=1 Tax=Acer saccharum TaxID=4024 RepID=A0AA39VTF2_ACESA|nr:hypothetical protein LWI29_032179 [Acer saccharum]
MRMIYEFQATISSPDRKFKLRKGSNPGDLRSRLFVRNQIEDNVKVFQPRQDLVERPASITSSRDRNLVDASSGWPLKVTSFKSLKRTYSSMMNQETRSNSMDILKALHGTNVQLNHEFLAARDEIDKENVFKVRTESMSLGDDNSSPKNGLENGRECCGDKNGKPVKVRKVDRHDDVSNTCMMDSISVLGLSPDNVVGMIGEKQFWKARRAIIDQQRVFAVQVFELHRLMKVQKLIARSPHLLLDDQLYMNKPHLDMSLVKKLPPKSILQTSPQIIVKPKDNSQKPDLRMECEDENAVGLVYKPYTGPCPPTAGFVAPFYGSCGPVSLTPAGGDFLSTAYGVPASHQQGIGILPGNPPLGQTYFPPYGMPVMNPSISSSAVKQMSPFPGTWTKDNHLSVGDINFIMPNQSSCDMSSQMSRAISCCLGKFQDSKESEVQGSTASSPAAERAKGDALPLFPMEPIVQASDQNAQTNEQQSRVIKVVPHNPRLATESAARIFQSIQEGRKQWAAIASQLPGRTDNEIKNLWNTHLKKRMLGMGIDPQTHESFITSCGPNMKAPASPSTRHMAQWERARLEAEARLSRESLLFNPPPAPPEKADSDYFLRIWNSEIGESFRKLDKGDQTTACQSPNSQAEIYHLKRTYSEIKDKLDTYSEILRFITC